MSQPSIELSDHGFALARAELLEVWSRIEQARDRFLASLKEDSELPAWCESTRTSHAARAAAVEMYAAFFYRGMQSPRSVHRLIGLIGASAATIGLAHKLNAQKLDFADCLGRLQNCIWIDERQTRHPLVRTAFQQLKIGRLNTLQATRQVVIVAEGLQRISWSISHKTRTKQVSREEVIRYIRANPSREIRLAHALAKLERLPPNTLLARYRPGSKLAVANATYLNRWGKPENRQYSSGMPLLMELTPGQLLPPCSPPNRASSQRKARPTSIESTDFVKALNLRRYRQQPGNHRPLTHRRPLSRLFRGP